MKVPIILILACLTCTNCMGQFLGGFFSQKKENRKLLAQQIAALQIYKGYISKGYDIISQGTKIISRIKSGDFSLHRDFFGALKIVNPKIRKYAKVCQLLELNVIIIKRLKDLGKLARSDLMSNSDNLYLQEVIDQTFRLLADMIDELLMVITDSQVDMKDDERIKRIDDLYSSGEEKFSFVNHMIDDVALYVRMKERKKLDLEATLILNGAEVNKP